MTPAVKKLYNEAKSNKLFNRQFKDNDSEYSKPNEFSDNDFKVLYTSIYMGWLIGRGEYKESNCK